MVSSYDVKLSEVHGMAQRGGSVVTFVRYGDAVAEPIVEEGQADVLIHAQTAAITHGIVNLDSSIFISCEGRAAGNKTHAALFTFFRNCNTFCFCSL